MKARLLCAMLAIAAPAALACGVCAEDKLAATYDHAVVQRAAATGMVLVYCELAGPIDGARIGAVARRQRGIDPASVRVSASPGAMSFALDTKRQSPQAVVAEIQRRAPAGTRVSILRVGSP